MPIATQLFAQSPWLRPRSGIALLILLGLVAFSLGGPLGVTGVALTGLTAAGLSGLVRSSHRAERGDGLTGLGLRVDMVAALDHTLCSMGRTGRSTAALVLEIDGFKHLETRHDRAEVERLLRVTADRLDAALRGTDTPVRLEGPTFAVALQAERRLTLEATLKIAGRLQRVLSEPVAVGGMNLHPTLSIGIALPQRLPAPTGESLLQAATIALIEAQRSGPAAIRSFSESMRARVESRGTLVQEVAAALDRGEIRGFFQPQVSTQNGSLTGFETLAR